MRIADIDHIACIALDAQPMRLVQSAAPLAAASQLVVTGLAAAALLAPCGIIAAHAASDPGALAALAERPVSTALLSAGLFLALGLVIAPLLAALSRLSRRTVVAIENGRLLVEEHGLTGITRWSARTGEFKGIAHHVRATLSGPRHELILVHPDRNKDILLQIANRPGELSLEQFSLTLGLAEIPARELYGRRRRAAPQQGGVLDLNPATA